MTTAPPPPARSVPHAWHRAAWFWTALIVLLLALRLPSLVEPAGGDQGLYAYAGQQMLHGAVPYVDVWDQKPPGVQVLYAGLETIWPHESIVPAADLGAAILVALLLIAIGRRRFTANVGAAAAVLFLLFGDPSLQRNSGVYVRGQCEPFIALAVAAAVWLLASRARRRWHLVAAGACLAAAFWLKYNAITYGLPAAVAAWAWAPEARRTARAWVGDVMWIGVGFAGVAAIVLGYFAAHHALGELYLATVTYNLHYSGETYAGGGSVLAYIFSAPVDRARVDLLWFLGGLGALLLIGRRWLGGAAVTWAWLVAAILSVAINGGRDAPNYFVQAHGVLALAAAAGLDTLEWRPRLVGYAVAVVILIGLWRVGDDPKLHVRLGGLPGLVDNVRFDLQYARGRIDRDAYLARFSGPKFNALEIDQLARDADRLTKPGDAIYVFGFSGGSVCWKSDRPSASRFFWSYPVIIEFASDRPGYGSTGVLADLQRRPPALVALQKEQWQSEAFFLKTPALRDWLMAGYVRDHDTPMFSVWRRR